MISRSLRSTLRSAPGAAYHYSNVGYSLLAAIIDQVSGDGYEPFLADYLFSPAGMSNTGYVLPTWAPHQVAVEYDAQGEPHGTPLDHPWADDGPYWNLRGNGGMLSTARDMFRWHQALLGDEVLDVAAKEKLFTPFVREEPGGPSSYGYGWVVQDTPYGAVAAHDGGNNWSYGEVIRLLDHDVMTFWVTNQAKDRAAGWSMIRLSPTLTRGVVGRLLAG